MHEVGAKTSPGTRPDPLDVAFREVGVGIELVVSGRARVVELAGLEAAERAAGSGLAQAQVAGVRFKLRRTGSDAGVVSLRIGLAIDG